MVDGFTLETWEDCRRAIEALESIDPLDRYRGLGLTKAFVQHQEALRRRASQKFSVPEAWFWTRTLLEQASDEQSSHCMASGFPPNVPVVDICCGAGADTIALAQRGPVTALDVSPVAVALTSINLKLHGLKAAVVCSDAMQAKIDPQAWVHIDPDRRGVGVRTTRAEFFQPDACFLLHLIQHTPGGSIKVAPSTVLDPWKQTDLPGKDASSFLKDEMMGRQFLSWGGSVRQQRWWWNSPHYPAASTTASVWDRQQGWQHWTMSDRELTGIEIDYVTAWESLGGYVGDTDAAIRLAGMQAALAAQYQACQIGDRHGYLLRVDDKPPQMSVWVDWFQVETVLPFDRKRLRLRLREMQIGKLEIKSRGVDVPIESLRRELRLQGEHARSLLITRCGERTVAIIANRLRKA